MSAETRAARPRKSFTIGLLVTLFCAGNGLPSPLLAAEGSGAGKGYCEEKGSGIRKRDVLCWDVRVRDPSVATRGMDGLLLVRVDQLKYQLHACRRVEWEALVEADNQILRHIAWLSDLLEFSTYDKLPVRAVIEMWRSKREVLLIWEGARADPERKDECPDDRYFDPAAATMTRALSSAPN
jgi:hypothetical protein